MHLDALKIFCEVVRRKSFSRAAGAYHLSQSAVSQNISQLEKGLGVQLIDRSCRPFQLTPEGQLYYEGCKEIVERYYAIEAEVKGLNGDSSGTVRVAAIYSAGLERMSELVRRFAAMHPQAKVRLAYLHPDEVYASVLEDEADIGLVSFPRAGRGLAVLDWRRESMVVVCAAGHVLASRTKLNGKELDGQRFVGFSPGLRIGKEVDRQLRRCGCEVDMVMMFDNIETIKRAVGLGDAISILPEPMVAAEVAAGVLVAIPLISPRLERPMGIIHRRSVKFSRTVQAFVSLIRGDGDGVGSARGTRVSGWGRNDRPEARFAGDATGGNGSISDDTEREAGQDASSVRVVSAGI